MAIETMLVLKDISWHLPEKEILHGIDLTVPDGKLVVITGPNGGGKTSLAKLIAGIEKPDSGKILLDGRLINNLDVTERAKIGIAYAFQQPVRFKGITVFDLIQLASGSQVTVEEACRYLSEVGLCAKDYVRREVNASLSGGELKRIEIATVMARDAQMTLFDEPEAGIDLWSFQKLISVFEKMHDSGSHKSIFIISHQERILNIADEIMMIADGQLTARGTKEEILPQILSRTVSCGCIYRAQD